MSATPAIEPPDPAAPAPASCSNCGAPLRGLHCHDCGQPARSPVRHFRSVLGDLLDTALNLDGRLPRTLLPLLFRPGFLSLEYLAGRRARYVSPVRLFVFISLLAFLAGTFSVASEDAPHAVDTDDAPISDEAFAQAASVEAVRQLQTRARAALERPGDGLELAGVNAGLTAARAAVDRAAETRIAELEGLPAPSSAAGAAADSEPAASREAPLNLHFGDTPWHPQHNPLQLGWLPDGANARLNLWVGRAHENLLQLRGDREARYRLLAYLFERLPQTLFVLLPLFALMLKLAYAFRRRLYMEHLIIALHSHAFLSLALLLLALIALARGALAVGLGRDALDALSFALGAWMPLYLLLMQKRVYREGWALTLLKFALLGSSYVLLLIAGVVVTVLISLVLM